ncbi:phosphoadenylyl-sulfate reductase [Lentibacillus sp. N15]|uniref:phosphoadenylyl-sulfate reductase n=1 Tax=Lentibacillus songyuanensis TaxID=3136161 RepID=UPI0031BA7EB8
MGETLITYNHFPGDPFGDLHPDGETKGAAEILQWAYEQYGDDVIYACSFGAEGMVLIDLISKVKPNATVVFLDTSIHFQETYDLIDKVKASYPELCIQLKKPEITLEEQAAEYGSALWARTPDQCCFIRKIKPLEDVLQGVPAWISGLRREQSLSRKQTDFVNKDERFKLIKICPLIHWTWKNVWSYIKKYDLPYNELHDQGYPSIGCIPCTARVTDSNDSRAGRWSGFAKTECGLHTPGNDG